MTMNVKADSFHSKATPDASFQTPHNLFYDSPRCDHISYRSRNKAAKKAPLLSSIFTENEDKYEDRRFTMEGWNKKPQRIEQQNAVKNESEEDFVNSSQESLLEGSCRQNIFKNELTNLSNGLFSMHVKDTQRNNISKPYFQALTLKPSSRPVSVLQGRKKFHQNRYMSQERRSSSYVVKDKNKIEGEVESELEPEPEAQTELKKEKKKVRDKEREKGNEKDKEIEKKEKEKKKEKIKEKKVEGEKAVEKEKEKKKDNEKEKEKEIEEENNNEKEKETEKVKEKDKEREMEKEKLKEKEKKVEVEKFIEKEKEKPKINSVEKDKEKEKEKQPEKPQVAILPKCRFQEKYVREQDQEKKDKKLDLKKRVSANPKLIDYKGPVVQQKELPNKRLYLKVIQMLEKAKRPDDKPNGINSSSEFVKPTAETYEATPNKATSKQQKISLHSTHHPKYLSNSCLTSMQQENSESIRITKKSEASSKKDVLNDSNWSNSPLKESRTPSKFRSTLQALPAIENNNKQPNSFSNPIQIGGVTGHKINRISADKCSNSVIYAPVGEDAEPEDLLTNKNRSLVLEDERDSKKKQQYYSQRSSCAYGHPNQFSSNTVDEEFVPYSKQQKSYHAMLEPERKELDSQGRGKQGTRGKAWGQFEPKLKHNKEGAGMKFHVFQLPLPKIPTTAMPIKEPIKREKVAAKKNKRREVLQGLQGVEDFFRKDDDFETDRDIKSRFTKPKVEYLAREGIRGHSYHKTSSRLSNDISENKGITVSQEEAPGKLMRLALQDSTDKMLYLEASVKFMNDDSTEEDL